MTHFKVQVDTSLPTHNYTPHVITFNNYLATVYTDIMKSSFLLGLAITYVS